MSRAPPADESTQKNRLTPLYFGRRLSHSAVILAMNWVGVNALAGARTWAQTGDMSPFIRCRGYRTFLGIGTIEEARHRLELTDAALDKTNACRERRQSSSVIRIFFWGFSFLAWRICWIMFSSNDRHDHTMTKPMHSRFLGQWILDVDLCDYEQGEPPKSGSYRIEQKGDALVFHMSWVDAVDELNNMSFQGKPDGVPEPFDGGPLADALSITSPSEHRLDSFAFRDGEILMVATRRLSEDGLTMTIEQTVNLPDGTSPSNRSIYRKAN